MPLRILPCSVFQIPASPSKSYPECDALLLIVHKRGRMRMAHVELRECGIGAAPRGGMPLVSEQTAHTAHSFMVPSKTCLDINAS